MPSFVSLEKFKSQLETLPSAKFISIAGSGRIVSGSNPLEPEYEYDLAKEQFVPIIHQISARAKDGDMKRGISRLDFVDVRELSLPSSLRTENSRVTGEFFVRIGSKRIRFMNLKQALGGVVLELADNPSFLNSLAEESSRSRRLIAKKPEDLFDNPEMKQNAVDYSANLENGWWLNTNNSETQVKKWLNVIARVANLSWNKDFKVEF